MNTASIAVRWKSCLPLRRANRPCMPMGTTSTFPLFDILGAVAITWMTAASVAAHDRAIGVDHNLKPIQVWLDTNWDADERDPLRVVLVANEAGDSQARVASLVRWWESKAGMELRSAVRIAALGVPLTVDDATLVFPPEGPAYSRSSPASSHSIWRWMGIAAVDLVIVCGSDDDLAWSITPCEATRGLHAAMEKQFPGKQQPAREGSSLAMALPANRVAGVGSIPAVQLNERGVSERSLRELLAAMGSMTPVEHSSAAREIDRRRTRTAAEVASQLAEHYGHELPAVEYIPVVALWARMRRDEFLDRGVSRLDAERLAEPFRSGAKLASNESGSAMAGHLLFTELARRSRGDARQRWIELAKRAADLAFDESGSARDVVPHHLEMSDALFMAGPLLAAVGGLTEEQKYFDACRNHLRTMLRLLEREDGLLRHSPLCDAAWGRGNGFAALGLALCLAEWPVGDPWRDQLADRSRRHLDALLAHQDANGMWHQVVDRPESYAELSCTCMIAWTLIEGMQAGWIDRSKFDPVLRRAWDGIRRRIGSDGTLVDVCTGTGKQPSLQDYLQRESILGRDARGGAMALMLATRLAEWELPGE